jgi:ATP-dependent Clp protease ATP-binding subunit ClpX
MGSPDYTAKREKHLLPLIESLPEDSPKHIAQKLRGMQYIGQDAAVKAVSLMAYRHVRRLKRLYLHETPPETLPPKTNMLFVGPTGCGKTFLVELLFQEILSLPTVIVDMTTYSETGYVGQDVASILTRLLYAADLNPLSASIGVVCLDEFDKLSSGKNNAVFAGAGTTKDVSGLGVQRELLKMLEASEITVPLELSHSDYAARTVISTRDIPFIACGAFSGLKGLIQRRGEHIGFGREGLPGDQDKIAVSYSVDDVELSRNFLNYGLLPELIGRFKRFVPFSALTEDELAGILNNTILNRYRNEFRLEGIDLEVDDAVIERVLKDSIRKETGARGIETALMRFLEDAAFEAFSTSGSSRVVVTMNGDAVDYRLE